MSDVDGFSDHKIRAYLRAARAQATSSSHDVLLRVRGGRFNVVWVVQYVCRPSILRVRLCPLYVSVRVNVDLGDDLQEAAVQLTEFVVHHGRAVEPEDAQAEVHVLGFCTDLLA